MNFGFTEEQEFLRSTAREFLAAECPMTRVRELLDDPAGSSQELWQRMAELGWLGLLVPESLGGAGLGMVELVVVLEELGRALTPSPFFGNLLGTLALLRAGSDTQQKDLLPAVASGAHLLTLAVTEAPGSEDPELLQASARRHGADYRVRGTKLFVPDGQNADSLIVLARTGGPGAFSLLRVEASDPGVECVTLQSIDQTRRLAELHFDDARAELLGAEHGGWDAWQWLRDRALVALAAEALGGTEKVLEDAVAYAKQRVQFGKPIGVHQAIKHKCADMLIAVESCKSITYWAAWSAAEETDDAPLAAAMAKAYTSDAYRECSAENIQIHGGVGFTWEYDCHLYYKRAKALEVTFGDASLHRERVASLLGL